MDRTTTVANIGPTMRSLRERQREERAALILAVAQEVFADKGYHDASLDEIAARAGIAKGTVYLHFTSKEDLLAALIEQQIVEFLAQVDRVAGEKATVRTRLEHILLDVYTRMQERRNQVLLELNNSIGLTRSVIEKHEDLQAHITQAMERIAALLEEGKRTGELDGTVPTPIMAATFATLLTPSGYEQLLTSGQVSPAELVNYVSRIFFPGSTASQSEDS
ncbi:MAG TPA: TetR/AcrR family transcriptional regulator [Chloroflexia bacterium]|nr:TetR/AcrR family transcriptional regulator [Chloroflexia bacterium]